MSGLNFFGLNANKRQSSPHTKSVGSVEISSAVGEISDTRKARVSIVVEGDELLPKWDGVYSENMISHVDGKITDYLTIDLGSVYAHTVIPFSLYSGFLEDATIVERSFGAVEGLSVEGLNIGSLIPKKDTIEFSVEISQEGVVSVDWELYIKTDLSTDSFIKIRFVFNRLSLVPFPLDAEWASGLSVTKRYLTSVFNGDEGSETRVATRSNTPREIEVPMFFAGQSATLQAFSNALDSSARAFLMPYAPDATKLTQAPVGKTVYMNTAFRRFIVGYPFIVVSYTSKGEVLDSEVLETLEVFEDRIIVRTDPQKTFEAGATAYPVIVCQPAIEGNSISPVTSAVGLVTLTAVEIYGASMLPPDNNEHIPEALKGLPVSPFKVNWKDAPSLSVNNRGGLVDSGVSRIPFTRGSRSGISFSSTASLLTRAKSWEASGFLTHIQGMLRPFWTRGPLELFDVIIIQSLVTETEIRIKPFVRATNLGSVPALWLEDVQGEKDIQYINRIEDNEKYTSIFIPLPSVDIAKVYDARIVRLSSDEVVETFITDEVSEIGFTFTELTEAYNS